MELFSIRIQRTFQLVSTAHEHILLFQVTIKTYNLFLDIFQRLEIRCFTYLQLNGFE